MPEIILLSWNTPDNLLLRRKTAEVNEITGFFKLFLAKIFIVHRLLPLPSGWDGFIAATAARAKLVSKLVSKLVATMQCNGGSAANARTNLSE